MSRGRSIIPRVSLSAVRRGEGSRVIGLVTGAALSLVALYSAQAALPNNSLNLPAQAYASHYVPTIAPQGWAFFTKSARSQELIPYQPAADGTWSESTPGTNAEPRNAFGWNRQSRTQGIELALLTARIPGDAWATCDRDLAACDKDVEKEPVALPNDSPSPSLCGTTLLTLERPVPYAWRDIIDEPRVTEHAVQLELQC